MDAGNWRAGEGERMRAAVAAGANAIGFVFWPKSPRYVDPALARKIAATLPETVNAVGVFVDQPAEDVNEIADWVARVAPSELAYSAGCTTAFEDRLKRLRMASNAGNALYTTARPEWQFDSALGSRKLLDALQAEHDARVQ